MQSFSSLISSNQQTIYTLYLYCACDPLNTTHTPNYSPTTTTTTTTGYWFGLYPLPINPVAIRQHHYYNQPTTTKQLHEQFQQTLSLTSVNKQTKITRACSMNAGPAAKSSAQSRAAPIAY